MVVAEAGAEGHAPAAEGVTDVAAADRLREADVALARDLGDAAARLVDRVDLVAGEGRRGAGGILAVAEAELELVLAARRVLEVVAVHVDDVPGLARREAVVGPEGGVEHVVHAALLVGPAARREPVAPSEVGVLGVQVEVRAEGVVPLRLEEAVQRAGHAAALFRIEVALVPEEGVGLVGGLAGRASELDLRSVEEEQRQHVVAAGLPVQLAVPVLEDRLVLGPREARDADVVAAEGAPEPQLVLDQRAAEVRAPVEDLVRVVGFRLHALQLFGQVVGLELVVGQEAAHGAVQRVGAALAHEVDPMPPVATLRSPPPVVTLISSKASKS
jgi:hypothetical protein